MIRDHNIPAPGSRYVVHRVRGRDHVVLDPSRKQVGGICSIDAATTSCEALNAELDRKKKRGPRPCMCCGHFFASEGIHNRMCDPCRRRGQDVDGIVHSVVRGGRKGR